MIHMYHCVYSLVDMHRQLEDIEQDTNEGLLCISSIDMYQHRRRLCIFLIDMYQKREDIEQDTDRGLLCIFLNKYASKASGYRAGYQ